METRVRRTTVFKRFSVTRDPPRPWRKVFVNVGKMKLYRWQHARGNKVTPITNNVWDPKDLVPRSPSPVPADTAAAADVAAAITSTTSTAPESSFHDDKPNGSSVATNAVQVSADEPLSVADTKQDAAVCSSDATLVHTNTVSTGRVSPIASTTSSSAAAAVTSTSSAQSSIPTALSSIPTTQSSISTAMSSSLSGTAVASGAPGVSGDLTNSTVSSTLTMPVHSVAITTQSPQGVVRGASVMGEGEPSHATQCTDGTIQQGENVAVASVEAAVAVRTHPQL